MKQVPVFKYFLLLISAFILFIKQPQCLNLLTLKNPYDDVLTPVAD